MTTRRRTYNHLAKDLGETLVRKEWQHRWHGASDEKKMPFYENRGGVFPQGKHPSYPTAITTLATACEYLNECKRQFNLHDDEGPPVHLDVTNNVNEITTPDATDLATAITLIIAMRNLMSIHALAGNPYHGTTQESTLDEELASIGNTADPATEQDVMDQTLIFVNAFRNHLFVGPMRLDEEINYL